MNIAIVSPEIVGPHKNGGIGTFATIWSMVLREAGENVTLIYTGEYSVPSKQWHALYDRHDIRVIHAAEGEFLTPQFNYEPFIRRSEKAASVIPPDTDVVYFQDWQASGFHFVRTRQYQPKRTPLCVTVLHGSYQWVIEANKWFPTTRQEMELQFAERYVVANSDYIVSPSQYMFNYVSKMGWELPPLDRCAVLGYPFLKPLAEPPNLVPADRFCRLIYFGRIETRKGIELFVDALQLVQRDNPHLLEQITEVVLLGREGVHRFGSLDAVIRQIKNAVPHCAVIAKTDLDTHAAQAYLQNHAADSLVVMPSLLDNFPFTLIEASLIVGLNVITANYGGQAEILGTKARWQTFEPRVRPLAYKISEFLLRSPHSDAELNHYDWQSANTRWLNFHQQICDEARRKSRSSTAQPIVSPAQRNRSVAVDVCLAYYNHPDYLPSALKALARQTTDDYELWIINDGSTSPRANEVFEQMRVQYGGYQNWHFVHKEQNTGLSDTRNYAASLGNAELLCFVDADNISMPNMLERFIYCMRQSGKDALTCATYWFEGDDTPYLSANPGLLGKPVHYWLPLGASLELGLFHDIFGDANFTVKRSVFEAVGKFFLAEPLDNFTAGEDWEILTRLVVQGYKLDVIPEVLFFYRVAPDSMSRHASRYDWMMRILRVYRAELHKVGLQHLIPWIYKLYEQANRVYQTADTNVLATEQHVLGNEAGLLHHLTQPERLALRVPWQRLAGALLLKAVYFPRKVVSRIVTRAHVEKS
jgi:O-antigen biosynthesis protein